MDLVVGIVFEIFNWAERGTALGDVDCVWLEIWFGIIVEIFFVCCQDNYAIESGIIIVGLNDEV